MAEWMIIQPQTTEQWENYYRLRFDILRKPWGQPLGSEKELDDDSAVHTMIIDKNGMALAVCRIHLTKPGEAQIRFMAVHYAFQRIGLGQAILRFTEHLGIRKFEGLQRIILHARQQSLPFYESNGYRMLERSHLLFGNIQHYLMEKLVIPTNTNIQTLSAFFKPN